MYVEISPRQSGKTTRLVQAVINYLQQNTEHTVAVVGFNSRAKNELKEKISRQINDSNIVIDDNWAHRVNFLSGNLFGKYNREPNYWFFDEFSFLPPSNLLHPIYSNVIENAYYCTTPASDGFGLQRRSIDIIVNHCRQNNIEINFVNPWTERRLTEQGGFADYIRGEVLNQWREYMTNNGFKIGLTENWIPKFIKKHKFNGK